MRKIKISYTDPVSTPPPLYTEFGTDLCEFVQMNELCENVQLDELLKGPTARLTSYISSLEELKTQTQAASGDSAEARSYDAAARSIEKLVRTCKFFFIDV